MLFKDKNFFGAPRNSETPIMQTREFSGSLDLVFREFRWANVEG